MAIQASPEVAKFLQVITGEEMPGLNEDRLFAIAEGYREAARGLADELAPLVVAAVNGIRANFSGESERAYADSMAKFVTEHPRYLYTAAEELTKAADAARTTGTQVQYVKLIIILTVVELMIEIAVAIAMAVFFPNMWGWVAARSAMVRFLIKNWLGRLVMQIVTNMVMGVVFQVAMDALAQRIQLGMGTRDSWDWDLTKQSAEVGALGGATSLGLGWLGKGAGKLFKSTADDVTSLTPPPRSSKATGPDFKGDPGDVTPPGSTTRPHQGGNSLWQSAGDIGQEAAAEYLTEGLYGVLKGEGWDVSGFAITSGLVSGVNGLAGEHMGAYLHQKFPNASLLKDPGNPASGTGTDEAPSGPTGLVNSEDVLPADTTDTTGTKSDVTPKSDELPPPSGTSTSTSTSTSTTFTTGQQQNENVVPSNETPRVPVSVLDDGALVDHPGPQADVTPPPTTAGQDSLHDSPDQIDDTATTPVTPNHASLPGAGTMVPAQVTADDPVPSTNEHSPGSQYLAGSTTVVGSPLVTDDSSGLTTDGPSGTPLPTGPVQTLVTGRPPADSRTTPPIGNPSHNGSGSSTTRSRDSKSSEGPSEVDVDSLTGPSEVDVDSLTGPSEVDVDSLTGTSTDSDTSGVVRDESPAPILSLEPVAKTPTTPDVVVLSTDKDTRQQNPAGDSTTLPTESTSAVENEQNSETADDPATQAVQVDQAVHVFPSHRQRDADIAAAKLLNSAPESTRIAVHLTDGRADVNGRLMTAAEFAELVTRTIPDLRDRVELVACSAAAPTAQPTHGGNSFAHDLALALGRTVVGATTPAWSALDRNAPRTLRTIAASIVVDADGRMRPRIPPDGQFIEFTPNPDGTVTERRLGAALDEMPTELDSAGTDGTPDNVPVTDDAGPSPDAYHLWANLVSGINFPKTTPNPAFPSVLQGRSGLIGGPVVPVVGYSGAEWLRARLKNQIRAEIPTQFQRIEKLVDSALAEQVSDEALADGGVQSMLNGSGMRISIGTGPDALEVVLRAKADEAGLDKVAASGSSESSAPVSDGKPDIREPARTGVSSQEQVGNNRGFTLGAGFSTITAGIMGFFGSLSVAGSHRAGKSAALSRGNRTNMEITRPSADKSDFYQVPLTGITATLERRGAASTKLDLAGLQPQAAVILVPKDLDTAAAPIVGTKTEYQLPSRWVYEGGSIAPENPTSPPFAEQVLALMPPGVTKTGSKNRSEILALITPEGLADLDGALSYAGHRSDKFVSRTGPGTGIDRWLARISAASKDSLSLTSKVGKPEFLVEMSTGKAETAVRVEGAASTSTTQEKVTQVAATAGGFGPFHDVTTPEFFAAAEIGAVLRADRANSSESTADLGYRMDMKSKSGEKQLLYAIPIAVTATQIRGTSPASVEGKLTVYTWLTPQQAVSLGYPVPPSVAATATGSGAAAVQTLPAKLGTTNGGEQFQPLPLADVTHVETSGLLVDDHGNDRGEPATDLATQLIEAANRIDQNLLPKSGELGTARQRKNLRAIREAASRPSLTGRWRSLRGTGISVALRSGKRGGDTGSRTVVLNIRTEIGALTASGPPSPKTQLELVTQGFTAKGDRATSSVGVSAGITAGGRIRTSWWGASRGMFARLVVAWTTRSTRTMAGSSTYLDSHLTKVEVPLHNFKADMTFVVSSTQVDDNGRVTDTNLFRLKSVEGFQVALPEGTATATTAATSTTTTAPASPVRKAEISVNSPLAVTNPFVLAGPHAFVDADISPKMADAIDIALAKNGTITTATATGTTVTPIRAAGAKPRSGWGSPGRRSIDLGGGKTADLELSYLSDPGSIAERQIKELLATPEGVMSLLELMDEHGTVDLLRLGIFSDLTGTFKAKFELGNPQRLRKIAKAKLYDSAETSTSVASGSSKAQGIEFQAQAGVATATPNGDHRQAPNGQLGRSFQKSATNSSDHNATVGRRLVYDGEVSELLADALVTITGTLGTGKDSATGATTDIDVKVLLPESVVVMVPESEANRLVPPATATTATTTTATTTMPAPQYLTSLVGNAYVRSVDHSRINATTAQTKSLAEELVDSAAIPESLKTKVIEVINRLLSLGGLRRGVHALYSGGRTSTFTIPGLLEKQVVKVTVTAEGTGVSGGTKLDKELSVSLFQATSSGKRTAENRRRVFGGGFGLTAMFSRASSSPVNGPGLITNLDAAGLGLAGSGNVVDDKGTTEVTVDGSSGYVEKSGPLVEYAVSQKYRVSVTSQRVPTMLGAAWMLVRFKRPGSRTTWETPATGGVDRHEAVKIAVPESAVDRLADLSDIGTSNPLADPENWAPANNPGGDPDQLWIPEDRSFSIEGALLGEVRALIQEAFTEDGSIPTLVQDQTTDMILDRLMSGDTNVAELGAALSRSGITASSLHDGTGLQIKTAGFIIQAALKGQPIVVDSGKTDQEAQTESSTATRGQSSSSSGIQGGVEQINTGDASSGTVPPPNPKHQHSSIAAAGLGATHGAGHQNGTAVSDGRKVKQSGHSATLVYDLALRIIPTKEGSGRGRLSPKTVGKVITKGAMVRFWEGDLKALGYDGWPVGPNFPKKLENLSGKAVLRADNGQLVMHPEGTATTPQNVDSSSLHAGGPRTLTVSDGVEYQDVVKFLENVRSQNFPAPQRVVFEPRLNAHANGSTDDLLQIVALLDEVAGADIEVEIRRPDPGSQTWQQVKTSLVLTGKPLAVVAELSGNTTTWPPGLTATTPAGGTFSAADAIAPHATTTASTSTAGTPTATPGKPTTLLGLPTGWVVEAVAAGWWVRPATGPHASANAIRLTPQDPDRPILWVEPGPDPDDQVDRTTLLNSLRDQWPDSAARAVVREQGDSGWKTTAAGLWQHLQDPSIVTIPADPVPGHGIADAYRKQHGQEIEQGKTTWQEMTDLFSGTARTVPAVTEDAVENFRSRHADLHTREQDLSKQINDARDHRTALNNLRTRVQNDLTLAGTSPSPELIAAGEFSKGLATELDRLTDAITKAEQTLQAVRDDLAGLDGWNSVTDAGRVAGLLTDLARGHRKVDEHHLVIPSLNPGPATTGVQATVDAVNAAAARWRLEVEAAENAPKERDTVRIFVHGSADQVRAGTGMLTAKEFAAMLPEDFRNSLHDKQLILISCEAAKTPADGVSFAEQLGTALKPTGLAQIVASPFSVATSKDGTAYAFETNGTTLMPVPVGVDGWHHITVNTPTATPTSPTPAPPHPTTLQTIRTGQSTLLSTDVLRWPAATTVPATGTTTANPVKVTRAATNVLTKVQDLMAVVKNTKTSAEQRATSWRELQYLTNQQKGNFAALATAYSSSSQIAAEMAAKINEIELETTNVITSSGIDATGNLSGHVKAAATRAQEYAKLLGRPDVGLYSGRLAALGNQLSLINAGDPIPPELLGRVQETTNSLRLLDRTWGQKNEQAGQKATEAEAAWKALSDAFGQTDPSASPVTYPDPDHKGFNGSSINDLLASAKATGDDASNEMAEWTLPSYFADGAESLGLANLDVDQDFAVATEQHIRKLAERWYQQKAPIAEQANQLAGRNGSRVVGLDAAIKRVLGTLHSQNRVDNLLGAGDRIRLQIAGRTHSAELVVRLRLEEFAGHTTAPDPDVLARIDKGSSTTHGKSATETASSTMSVGFGGAVVTPVGATVSAAASATRQDTVATSVDQAVVTQRQSRPNGDAGVIRTRLVLSIELHDADSGLGWETGSVGTTGTPGTAREAGKEKVEGHGLLSVPLFLLTGSSATKPLSTTAPPPPPRSEIGPTDVIEGARTTALWNALEKHPDLTNLMKVGTHSRARIWDMVNQIAVADSAERFVNGFVIPAMRDESAKPLNKWIGPITVTGRVTGDGDSLGTTDQVTLRVSDQVVAKSSLTNTASDGVAVSGQVGYSAYAPGTAGQDGGQAAVRVEGSAKRDQTATSAEGGGRKRVLVYDGETELRRLPLEWTIAVGGTSRSSLTGDYLLVREGLELYQPAAGSHLPPSALASGESIGNGVVLSITKIKEVANAIAELVRNEHGLTGANAEDVRNMKTFFNLHRPETADEEIGHWLTSASGRAMADSLLSGTFSIELKRSGRSRSSYMTLSVKFDRSPQGFTEVGFGAKASIRQTDLHSESLQNSTAVNKTAGLGARGGFLHRQGKGKLGVEGFAGYRGQRNRQAKNELALSRNILLQTPKTLLSGATIRIFADKGSVTVSLGRTVRPRRWFRVVTLAVMAQQRFVLVADPETAMGDPNRHKKITDVTMTVAVPAGETVDGARPVSTAVATPVERLPARSFAIEVTGVKNAQDAALKALGSTSIGNRLANPGMPAYKQVKTNITPERLVGLVTQLLGRRTTVGRFTERQTFGLGQALLTVESTISAIKLDPDRPILTMDSEAAMSVGRNLGFAISKSDGLRIDVPILTGSGSKETTAMSGSAPLSFVWAKNSAVSRSAGGDGERNVVHTGPYVFYRVEVDLKFDPSDQKANDTSERAGTPESAPVTVSVAISLRDVRSYNSDPRNTQKLPLPADVDTDFPESPPMNAKAPASISGAPPHEWHAPDRLLKGGAEHLIIDSLLDSNETAQFFANVHTKLRSIDSALSPSTAIQDHMGNSKTLENLLTEQSLRNIAAVSTDGGTNFRLYRKSEYDQVEGLDFTIEATWSNTRFVDIVDDGTELELYSKAKSQDGTVQGDSVSASVAASFSATSSKDPNTAPTSAGQQSQGSLTTGGAAIRAGANTTNATSVSTSFSSTTEQVSTSTSLMARMKGDLTITIKTSKKGVTGTVLATRSFSDLQFRIAESLTDLEKTNSNTTTPHSPLTPAEMTGTAIAEWQSSGTALPIGAVVISGTGATATQAALFDSAKEFDGKRLQSFARMRAYKVLGDTKSLVPMLISGFSSNLTTRSHLDQLSRRGVSLPLVGAGLLSGKPPTAERYLKLGEPRFLRILDDYRMERPTTTAANSSSVNSHAFGDSGALVPTLGGDLVNYGQNQPASGSNQSSVPDKSWTLAGDVPLDGGHSIGDGSATANEGYGNTTNPKYRGRTMLFEIPVEERVVIRESGKDRSDGKQADGHLVEHGEPLVVEVSEADAREFGWLEPSTPGLTNALANWTDTLTKRKDWISRGKKMRDQRARLADAVDEVTAATSERKAADDEVADLKTTETELEAERTELQEDIARRTAEFNALSEEFTQGELDLANAVSELERLNASPATEPGAPSGQAGSEPRTLEGAGATEVTRSIDEARSRVAKLRKLTGSLESRMIDIQGEIAKRTEDLLATGKEIDALKEQISAAQGKLLEKERALQDAEAAKDTIEQEPTSWWTAEVAYRTAKTAATNATKALPAPARTRTRTVSDIHGRNPTAGPVELAPVSLNPDSDKAGGINSPDQSAWKPVGSATAVARLLTDDPNLRSIDSDREQSTDPVWLQNCVLATLSAIMQILDPAQQYRIPPMVATDVDVLTSVLGTRTLDTDGIETIARALPVKGAMGAVTVNARPGEAGHTFLAVRVDDRTDSTNPLDGIAFYDPQSGQIARMPDNPIRLRFSPVPETGVDLTPIETAPRTPPISGHPASHRADLIAQGRQAWRQIEGLDTGASSQAPALSARDITVFADTHKVLLHQYEQLTSDLAAAKTQRTALDKTIGNGVSDYDSAEARTIDQLIAERQRLDDAITAIEQATTEMADDISSLEGWATISNTDEVVELLTDLTRGHRKVGEHLVIPSLHPAKPGATTPVETIDAAARRWRSEVEAAERTPAEAGTVRIFAHGSAGHLRSGTRSLDAGAFAATLPDDFRDTLNGKQLILVACEAAKIPPQKTTSFAEDLTRVLADFGLSATYASPGLVGTTPDGATYALAVAENGVMRLITGRRTGWLRFTGESPEIPTAVPEQNLSDDPTTESAAGNAVPDTDMPMSLRPLPGVGSEVPIGTLIWPDTNPDPTAQARKNGVHEETIKYLYDGAEMVAQVQTDIGVHPDWVNPRALGKWVTDLALVSKYRTLLALNRRRPGPAGNSRLLYLGANADVDHPLFVTASTHYTFVGIDPEALGDEPSSADANTARRAHLDSTTDVIVNTLRRYAADGYEVDRQVINDQHAIVTVKNAQTGDAVLTVEYHAVTYAEYLGDHSGEEFGVVMDKDSWLLGWEGGSAKVAEAVAGWLVTDGYWIGGFELSTAGDDPRFADDRLTVDGDRLQWSSQERLQLRRRLNHEPTLAPPQTADEADEVWSNLIFRHVKDQFDSNFDGHRYAGLMKVLEMFLPYVDNIESHLDSIADRLAGKIAEYADPEVFNRDRIATSLRGILQPDQPSSSTTDEAAQPSEQLDHAQDANETDAFVTSSDANTRQDSSGDSPIRDDGGSSSTGDNQETRWSGRDRRTDPSQHTAESSRGSSADQPSSDTVEVTDPRDPRYRAASDAFDNVARRRNLTLGELEARLFDPSGVMFSLDPEATPKSVYEKIRRDGLQSSACGDSSNILADITFVDRPDRETIDLNGLDGYVRQDNRTNAMNARISTIGHSFFLEIRGDQIRILQSYIEKYPLVPSLTTPKSIPTADFMRMLRQIEDHYRSHDFVENQPHQLEEELFGGHLIGKKDAQALKNGSSGIWKIEGTSELRTPEEQRAALDRQVTRFDNDWEEAQNEDGISSFDWVMSRMGNPQPDNSWSGAPVHGPRATSSDGTAVRPNAEWHPKAGDVVTHGTAGPTAIRKLQDELTNINPNYEATNPSGHLIDPDAANNCNNAAIIGAAIIRNIAHGSPERYRLGGSDPAPGSHLIRAFDRYPVPVASFQHIIDSLKEAGPYAQAIVGIRWTAETGHRINVFNHPDHGVVFWDFQANLPAEIPANPHSLEILPVTSDIPGIEYRPGPGPEAINAGWGVDGREGIPPAKSELSAVAQAVVNSIPAAFTDVISDVDATLAADIAAVVARVSDRSVALTQTGAAFWRTVRRAQQLNDRLAGTSVDLQILEQRTADLEAVVRDAVAEQARQPDEGPGRYQPEVKAAQAVLDQHRATTELLRNLKAVEDADAHLGRVQDVDQMVDFVEALGAGLRITQEGHIVVPSIRRTQSIADAALAWREDLDAAALVPADTGTGYVFGHGRSGEMYFGDRSATDADLQQIAEAVTTGRILREPAPDSGTAPQTAPGTPSRLRVALTVCEAAQGGVDSAAARLAGFLHESLVEDVIADTRRVGTTLAGITHSIDEFGNPVTTTETLVSFPTGGTTPEPRAATALPVGLTPQPADPNETARPHIWAPTDYQVSQNGSLFFPKNGLASNYLYLKKGVSQDSLGIRITLSRVTGVASVKSNGFTYLPYSTKEKFLEDCLHSAEEIINGKRLDYGAAVASRIKLSNTEMAQVKDRLPRLLEERKNELENSKNDLTRSVVATELQIEELKNEIAKKKHEVDSLQAEINTLEDKKRTPYSRNSSFTPKEVETIRSNRDRIKEINRKIALTKKEIGRSEKYLRNQQGEVEALHERIDGINSFLSERPRDHSDGLADFGHSDDVNLILAKLCAGLDGRNGANEDPNVGEAFVTVLTTEDYEGESSPYHAAAVIYREGNIVVTAEMFANEEEPQERFPPTFRTYVIGDQKHSFHGHWGENYFGNQNITLTLQGRPTPQIEPMEEEGYSEEVDQLEEYENDPEDSEEVDELEED